MLKIVRDIVRLFVGLFFYAFGMVMTFNANLGFAPWDVFHQGLSKNTGLTMGQAGILVGFVLVVLNVFLGEKIGWGTLFNMLFIGIFVDLLMFNKVIPSFESLPLRFLLLILGMLTISFATYLYIGAQLGAGPRDGLMLALTKKTRKPVWLIRNSIEALVLIIGYFLGGAIGVGTLCTAVIIGYFVQFTFKLFKFEVGTIHHRYINEGLTVISKRFKTEGENERPKKLIS